MSDLLLCSHSLNQPENLRICKHQAVCVVYVVCLLFGICKYSLYSVLYTTSFIHWSLVLSQMCPAEWVILHNI